MKATNMRVIMRTICKFRMMKGMLKKGTKTDADADEDEDKDDDENKV